jgi:hypothetical protein
MTCPLPEPRIALNCSFVMPLADTYACGLRDCSESARYHSGARRAADAAEVLNRA